MKHVNKERAGKTGAFKGVQEIREVVRSKRCAACRNTFNLMPFIQAAQAFLATRLQRSSAKEIGQDELRPVSPMTFARIDWLRWSDEQLVSPSCVLTCHNDTSTPRVRVWVQSGPNQ